jgi:hypothetical protein
MSPDMSFLDVPIYTASSTGMQRDIASGAASKGKPEVNLGFDAGWAVHIGSSHDNKAIQQQDSGL